VLAQYFCCAQLALTTFTPKAQPCQFSINKCDVIHDL
jgi:hypothetical protein